MFTGLGEQEKGKKHDQSVKILLFCLYFDTQYNELFLSFVELFSFKSYDIATAYLWLYLRSCFNNHEK